MTRTASSSSASAPSRAERVSRASSVCPARAVAGREPRLRSAASAAVRSITLGGAAARPGARRRRSRIAGDGAAARSRATSRSGRRVGIVVGARERAGPGSTRGRWPPRPASARPVIASSSEMPTRVDVERRRRQRRPRPRARGRRWCPRSRVRRRPIRRRWCPRRDACPASMSSGPSSVSSTFAGFTSRWTMAWPCSTASASATGAKVAAAAGDREAAVVDALREGRPVVEDEGEVGLAFVLARVEEADERRVVHPAEHRGLACEPGRGERILDAGPAELQRPRRCRRRRRATPRCRGRRRGTAPDGTDRSASPSARRAGARVPARHSSHSLRATLIPRGVHEPSSVNWEKDGDAALAGRGR